MASKYSFIAAISILSITFLASCLGGDTRLDIDPSSDAQIHLFSMESQADTDDVLRTTSFTIDQVNSRIFNRVFLPYRFSVDSVVLDVRGGHSNIFFGGLTEVRVHLVEPDTSFIINTTIRRDSIPLNRLRRIETQAADRETRRTYDVQLNIFQQDPFIITWVNTDNNYIASSPIQAQQTILLNNRFITYYLAGGAIGAMENAASDGVAWTPVPLTGLPATAQLSSLLSVGTAAFILDDANNVFATDRYGANWTQVATDVVTIFGVLPASTGGDILLIVDDNGTYTFAKTNDFTTLTLFNTVPANFVEWIPVTGFSAVQVDNPAVYGAKFIILSGGTNRNGFENSDIWLFEQASGAIRVLNQASGLAAQQGSTLFFYNNRLYMMIMTLLGENRLMYSENYGLSWAIAGEGVMFPADFIHRTHASIIADDDFIWVFGGQTPLGQFSDVWRGRLNLLDETL